jgi:hypothetical protein
MRTLFHLKKFKEASTNPYKFGGFNLHRVLTNIILADFCFVSSFIVRCNDGWFCNVIIEANL